MLDGEQYFGKQNVGMNSSASTMRTLQWVIGSGNVNKFL